MSGKPNCIFLIRSSEKFSKSGYFIQTNGSQIKGTQSVLLALLWLSSFVESTIFHLSACDRFSCHKFMVLGVTAFELFIVLVRSGFST